MNNYMNGKVSAIKDILKCIEILRNKDLSAVQILELLTDYCNDSIQLISKNMDQDETRIRSKYLEYYNKMLEKYSDEVNVDGTDA